MLISLLIFIGAAHYFMTREERLRVLQLARRAVERAYETAQGGPADKPFPTALRERTQWAVVTPTLIFLNIATFAFMASGQNPIGETQTLIDWGGNLGPRTANGEWQRLLTSMFVHAGMFQLLVNVCGLAALGFITERLVGSTTFATVYVTAGLFAGIVSLSANPMAVSFGASGAVLGIYGLLLAFVILSLFKQAAVAIPSTIVKRLGAAAGAFVLYNVLSSSLVVTAEVAGFAIGLVHGLVVTRGNVEVKPRVRRVAATVAAMLIIAAGSAARLAGIDDVRPEVESLIATERRTASAYDVEVERYKTRKTSEKGLLHLIDTTILPELRARAARLNALDKVLPEQRQLIESANTYLRLREESWRLRAAGLRQMLTLRSRGGSQQLHTSSMLALRKAETAEQAALNALQGVTADSIH